MKVCYNGFMRKLVLIVLFSILMMPAAFAKKFQVVVLPLKFPGEYSKFFSSPDIDEIVAADIISNFNSSYRIEAPNLDSLKGKINSSTQLKENIASATSKFIKNTEPDYPSLKYIAESFDAKSVLIVYSYVQEVGQSSKRDFYEIMKLASVFELQADYNLITEAVLFDNVNNLVMWSAVYKTPLNKRGMSHKIENNLAVIEQVNKVKIYSKDILSKNISQNVTLRFYPQSVRPITVKTIGEKMDSGMMRFDRDIPSIRKLINRKKGIPEYVEEPVDIENDIWNEWGIGM